MLCIVFRVFYVLEINVFIFLLKKTLQSLFFILTFPEMSRLKSFVQYTMTNVETDIFILFVYF